MASPWACKSAISVGCSNPLQLRCSHMHLHWEFPHLWLICLATPPVIIPVVWPDPASSLLWIGISKTTNWPYDQSNHNCVHPFCLWKHNSLPFPISSIWPSWRKQIVATVPPLLFSWLIKAVLCFWHHLMLPWHENYWPPRIMFDEQKLILYFLKSPAKQVFENTLIIHYKQLYLWQWWFD